MSTSPSAPAVFKCEATIESRPHFNATSFEYKTNPFLVIINAKEQVSAQFSKEISITFSLYIKLGHTEYEDGSDELLHLAYSEKTTDGGSTTIITYAGVYNSGGITVISFDRSRDILDATFKFLVQHNGQPPLLVEGLLHYDPS